MASSSTSGAAAAAYGKTVGGKLKLKGGLDLYVCVYVCACLNAACAERAAGHGLTRNIERAGAYIMVGRAPMVVPVTYSASRRERISFIRGWPARAIYTMLVHHATRAGRARPAQLGTSGRGQMR